MVLKKKEVFYYCWFLVWIDLRVAILAVRFWFVMTAMKMRVMRATKSHVAVDFAVLSTVVSDRP